MGFKTGSHGKVYNDSKLTKGSGPSPGNSDGSKQTIRDDCRGHTWTYAGEVMKDGKNYGTKYWCHNCDGTCTMSNSDYKKMVIKQ